MNGVMLGGDELAELGFAFGGEYPAFNGLAVNSKVGVVASPEFFELFFNLFRVANESDGTRGILDKL